MLHLMAYWGSGASISPEEAAEGMPLFEGIDEEIARDQAEAAPLLAAAALFADSEEANALEAEEAMTTRENREVFLVEAALEVFSYIPELAEKMDDIRSSLEAVSSVEQAEEVIEQFALLAATNKTEGGDAPLIKKRTTQVLRKIDATIQSLATQAREKEGLTIRITNIAIFYAALSIAGLDEEKVKFAFSGSQKKRNLFDPKHPETFMVNLSRALELEKLSYAKRTQLDFLLPMFSEFIKEGIHQYSGTIFDYLDQMIDELSRSDNSVESSAKVLELVKRLLIDLIPEFKGIFDEGGPLSQQTAQLHAATLVLSETASSEALSQMRTDYNKAESDEKRREVIAIACGESPALLEKVDALTASLRAETTQDEMRLATERAFASPALCATVINIDEFLVQAAMNLDQASFDGATANVMASLHRRGLVSSTNRNFRESTQEFLLRIATEVEMTIDSSTKTLPSRVRTRLFNLSRAIVDTQTNMLVQAKHPQSEIESKLLTIQVDLALAYHGIDQEQFEAVRAQEIQQHKQYKMRAEALTHSVDETRQAELMVQARINANHQVYNGFDSYEAMIADLVEQRLTEAMINGLDLSAFSSTFEMNYKMAYPQLSEVEMTEVINQAYHQLLSDEILQRRADTYKTLLEGVCERFVKQKVTFMTPPLEKMRELWTFNPHENVALLFVKFIGKLIYSIFALLYYGLLLNRGIDAGINAIIESQLRSNLVEHMGTLVTNLTGSISHKGHKKGIFGALNGLLESNLSVMGGDGATEGYDFAPTLDAAQEGDQDVVVMREIMEGLMSLATPQGSMNGMRHSVVTNLALRFSTSATDAVRSKLKDGLSLKQYKTSLLSSINSSLDHYSSETVGDTALDRTDGAEEERLFYASAKQIAKKVASDTIQDAIRSAPSPETEGMVAAAGRCAASLVGYVAESSVGQVLSSAAADMTLGAVVGDYVERVVENSVGFVFNESTLESAVERALQSLSGHLQDENTQRRLEREREAAERFAARKSVCRYRAVAVGPMGGMLLLRDA